MKQETLEEAGLKHCDMLDKFPALVNPLFSFKKGAKWQQERMSVEEKFKRFYDLAVAEDEQQEFIYLNEKIKRTDLDFLKEQENE